jgi:hypothetical protein
LCEPFYESPTQAFGASRDNDMFIDQLQTDIGQRVIEVTVRFGALLHPICKKYIELVLASGVGATECRLLDDAKMTFLGMSEYIRPVGESNGKKTGTVAQQISIRFILAMLLLSV